MNDHDAWVTDSFWGDEEEDDKNWASFEEQLQELDAQLRQGIDDDEYELWKANDMTTQKMNLEKALKDLQKQQATVEKLLRQTQRFPEEFPVGTVLKFKHVFHNSYYNSVKAYDYVALRADNGMWYLTCSGSKTMTWEQLLEFIGEEQVTVMVEGDKI